MRKISLVLIFCFLFQGCVSISSHYIASLTGNWIQESKKNKECTFAELFVQKGEDKAGIYSSRVVLIASIIDFNFLVAYYLKAHPIGLELFAAGLYGYVAVIAFVASVDSIKDRRGENTSINLKGWNHYFATECKEDYFVFGYGNEKDFLEELLHYPEQEEILVHFKKDFLRNNKIEIYINQEKHLYRYIHYSGGKAKFEEDFGKYLYKP